MDNGMQDIIEDFGLDEWKMDLDVLALWTISDQLVFRSPLWTSLLPTSNRFSTRGDFF